MMEKYRYQLHTHTSPLSKCSTMTSQMLVDALREEGYAGCVLTNHFLHGNTSVDRTLPWREFVSLYEEDYLACKAQGEKYGLDILFGIEEHVGGGREILCYGITPKMLYDHPELLEASVLMWCETLHALGAVVVQAHPYREMPYIKQVGPFPLGITDGIEVYNRGNAPIFNERARDYADAHGGMLLTSGSDAHVVEHVGIGGIEVDARITDERALARVLREGSYTLLYA